MIHNTLSKVLLVVALCVITAGCVDHSYDLEQIDRNVTVARDGIDISIGSIEPITIGDLVGDDFDDLVTINSDGSYSLSYTSDEPFDVRFSIPSSVDRTLGLKKYKGRYIDVDFPFISKPSGVVYDENGEADLSKKLPASRKILTRQDTRTPDRAERIDPDRQFRGLPDLFNSGLLPDRRNGNSRHLL